MIAKCTLTILFNAATPAPLLRTTLNEPAAISDTPTTGIPVAASSYSTDTKILDPAKTLGLVTVKKVLALAAKVDDTVVMIPLRAFTVTPVVILVPWVTFAVLYRVCKGAALIARGK